MAESTFEKLKIKAYTNNQDKSQTDRATEFEVLINPATVSMSAGLSYEEEEGSGKYPNNKFSKYQTETIQFKIFLDATGVIKKKDEVIDIVGQIKAFREVAYDLKDDKHEPNIVLVTWGEAFACDCRLQKLSINYKLFNNSGKPLRAELDVSFAIVENHTWNKKSSPDLSHFRVVKAGDTLPLMCESIYGDASFITQVARLNGIVNIRKLNPGQKILFPPLR